MSISSAETATSETFEIPRNITFRRSFQYYTPGTPNVAVDLSGQIARFHLRNQTSPTSYLTLASGSAPNANGSILTIDALAADADLGISIQNISLLMTDEETGLITFSRGYWYLELDNSGELTRLAHGKAVIVNP